MSTTIGETVSRVRNTLKAVKEDAFLTDRFIYSVVSKFAKLFILIIILVIIAGYTGYSGYNMGIEQSSKDVCTLYGYERFDMENATSTEAWCHSERNNRLIKFEYSKSTEIDATPYIIEETTTTEITTTTKSIVCDEIGEDCDE